MNYRSLKPKTLRAKIILQRHEIHSKNLLQTKLPLKLLIPNLVRTSIFLHMQILFCIIPAACFLLFGLLKAHFPVA